MKNFATITARFIDQPFKRFSCMQFLHDIYTELGVSVPDKWGQLTLANYMESFKADSYGTQLQLLSLVRSLGKPSSTSHMHLGDLLVVAQNPRHRKVVKPGFLPAIYCGKGQAMASFLSSGVSSFTLDTHNRPIVARRMI